MTRPGILGVGLLGLGAVLLALGVASACQGIVRLGAKGDETAGAEAASRAFVIAYGTYDDARRTTYTRAVAALTTGELRAALVDAGVSPDADRLRRRVVTRVEAVSLTALADNRATVAVTATQERRWVDPVTAAEQYELVWQRVRCELVQEDGRWLVLALHVEVQEPARRETR